MSASLTIPPHELRKLKNTLQEYAKLSKKTDAQIVNDKGRDWAFKAIPETEKADIEKFTKELGRADRKRVSRTKSGKVRRRKDGSVITRKDFALENAQFGKESFAARIINARLKAKGKMMEWGETLQKSALAMIAARRRAGSFIKSGWLAAARAFTSSGIKTKDGAQIRGQPKGKAIKAKESLVPFAVIVNTATKNSPQAAEVAQRGLIKAITALVADMRQYIERKKKQDVQKAGLG